MRRYVSVFLFKLKTTISKYKYISSRQILLHLITNYTMEDVEKFITRNSTRNSIHAREEAKLAELGYKQELPRQLSMMSILGLSFAIMVCISAI